MLYCLKQEDESPSLRDLIIHFCKIFLILLLFASIANASHQLVYKKTGTNADDYFGYSVAGAGDVNNDGKTDFIIGAPQNLLGQGETHLNPGYARVFSGVNGNLLYTKNPPDSDPCSDLDLNFGHSVGGAGNVDATAGTEIIIGAAFYNHRYGAAYVFRGTNGSLIYPKYGSNSCGCFPSCYVTGIRFGQSVAGAGDVNGDGRSDFIIGAPFDNGNGQQYAGKAFVYSGLDSSLLYEKQGGAANDYFGWSVAGAGDVNNDGKADFIVGAWGDDEVTFVNSGSAFVYSGATGNLLRSEFGIADGQRFGWSVAGTGDVNGDGKADFMVGAPGAGSGSGKAQVFSGAGGLIYTKNGSSGGDSLGYSVAGAGNSDGDGVPDFIVGAPNTSSGRGSAYLYSGINGGLIVSINGEVTGDGFGTSVAGGGDMLNDGTDEFLVGAPYADDDRGSAYVYHIIAVLGRASSNSKPVSFGLEQNYPNPFNPNTTIKYTLPQAAKVELKIYNILGQVVKTLVEEEKPAGFYEVNWDGRDEQGRSVSSSIYLYQIKAGDFVETKKMQLVK